MTGKKSFLEQAEEGLRWSVVSAALVYLVLGLVLILRPHDSSIFLCYIIGIALTVYGVFQLISFFFTAANSGAGALSGVLATAFGVYTLFQPAAIQGILFITFGILIVLNSFAALRHASLLKSFAFPGWWVFSLISVLTALVGFLMIFNYELFGSFLMIAAGCIMVYEALSGLWVVHKIVSLKKELTKE